MTRRRIDEILQRLAQSPSVVRDDWHVDEIDEAYRQRKAWIGGAVASFRHARDAVQSNKWPLTAAVEFFLRPRSEKCGCTVATVEALAEELSHTPPTLVVYRAGHEHWIHSTAFAEVPLPTGFPLDRPTRALFQEWFDQEDRDYDRRLWLVPEND